MYLLIVFLPLMGAITAGFFGRFIGKSGAQLLTTLLVSISGILSLIAFYEVALCGSPCYINLITWIDSELLYGSWGFMFDSLTVVMLVVITSVSSLVHLYSIEYMGEDPHVPRFMAYLSLFTFFMLILVTADNFIQMFVGWEGVGLSSYLLINFWFTRLQANKAAMKAMIVNRIGDFGLSLAMFAIFLVFKSIDFSTVFAIAPYFTESNFIFFNFELDKLTVICFLLFIGAVGKSAQIGLHTWLPDAMEGPTPVSALIHAATMVTAGVFLIIRCSPIFEYAPSVLMIVTFIGALTAFFAATTGMVQNDLKRVIAYSTCSQLGYMVFACGVSNYSVSMFHLMNHAFFKALLFLSAGSVIHALNDEQDMRKMGALIKVIPFTYSMMLIGSLSLMGFPFLTGFYSKDVILEVAYAKYTIDANFAHWLGTISAFFTSFYSFRLLFLTFLNDSNGYKEFLTHSHEAPLFMAVPLVILAFGSIFIGYITKDMLIGLGTNFWGNSLFILPEHITMLESEFIPYYIKLIPVIFSISGAIIAFFTYYLYDYIIYAFKLSNLGKIIYRFLSKKWYFDKIYNEFIVQKALDFGYNISFKTLDRGIIEIIGPYGIVQRISDLTNKITGLQSGYVYHYAFVMFIGLIILITFINIWNFTPFLFDYKLYFLYLIGLLFYNYSL
jgi:NADH-ubiquinone oxidoreductase chain 5